MTIDRRDFLEKVGIGSLGVGMLAANVRAQNPPPPDEKTLGAAGVESSARSKKAWQPVSDRKIRVGIVGYGVCKFGAAFGFQDHPNVEVVAVSDLIPERKGGLAKVCRCEKTYESLEILVKDSRIEAVFIATDAPNHVKHCIDALNHGKHVMVAVPATFGSIEQGEQLLETVERTGLKYMMAETSAYRANCHAMRQVYQSGGFGRLVYSEGEYFHNFSKPIGSFKNWRIGLPPMWYVTHSSAFYVHVTGERMTEVSCAGFNAGTKEYQPENNRYKNPFTDEIALFRTSEGGASRMVVAWGVEGHHGEMGRVFGERGSMLETTYQGVAKNLPNLDRPPIPPSVPQGGHGGSHGPLMNEFVTAILEDRRPVVDIYQALSMTIPGVVAHQSALKDGELLKIPQYKRPAT